MIFLNDLQKLIACIAIEQIGSTEQNRFIINDSDGTNISIQRFDHPSNGYILYNATQNKEMLHVKYNNANNISIYILLSNLTFEVELVRNSNHELRAGIVTAPQKYHDMTIILKDNVATFYNYSLEVSVKEQLEVAA